MKKLLLFMACLSVYTGLRAQAPGGVSDNLQFWIKADAGTSTTTDNTVNPKWTNIVDGMDNSSQQQPIYKISGANYNPTLTFNGSNNYYQWGNSDYGLRGVNNFQMFTIQTRSLNSTNQGNLVVTNTATGSFQYHNLNGAAGKQALYRLGVGQILAGSNNINTGTPTIHGIGRVGNNYTLYFNNLTDGTAVNTASLGTPGILTIARRPDSAGNFWAGNLHEVIIYSNAGMSLTATERLQINSYLALKYGITLIASDYLASDGTTKFWDTDLTYQNNIAGIARDDNSVFLQKQSKSENLGFQPIISLGNLAASNQANGASITADKSAMVWGCDTGATSFSTSYNFHDLSTRMTRVWKVQETGTIGTVKVYFPASDKPAILSTLSLLVSDSPTFDGSASKIQMSLVTINGIDYYTADVDFTNGQFFTFGGLATSPGGVSDNLQFWIKANAGTSTTTDNTVNPKWTNIVDGMDNSSQQQPIYKTSGANYNPTLTFNGSNNYYQWGNSDYGLRGVNNFQMFTIQTRSLNSTNQGNLVVTNAATGSFQYHNQNGAAGKQALHRIDVGQILAGSNNINTGTPTIHGIGRVGNNYTLYFNNLTDGTAVNTASLGTPGILNIARRPSGAGLNFWAGNLHEVIIYSNAGMSLTATERLQINSYLALKYGITLPASDYLASDGTTKFWDGQTNPAFHNRVFGIGLDELSALNQKVSRSESGVVNDLLLVLSTENNYTALNNSRTVSLTNDRSFVMIGDNGGTLTAPPVVIDCPLPDEDIVILDRKFRLQQTNNTDAFWLYVPTTNIPLKSKLSLMMGSGIDGSGNITGDLNIVEGIPSGNGFYFNLQLQDTERYFAIMGSAASSFCQVYNGDKITMNVSNAWDIPAARSSNQTSWYDVGTEGIVEAQQRISVNGISEAHPADNPIRGWGNHLMIRRKDNTNAPGNITYQVDFRDKATGEDLGIMPSFSVRGINIENSKRKLIRVVGYDCNGNEILPELSYRLTSGSRYQIRNHLYQAQGKTTGSNTWASTMMNVKFNQPVTRVEVVYAHNKIKNNGRDTRIFITDMTLVGLKPLPPTPDNIVIKQNFDTEPVPSCEDSQMSLTIINNNCDDKTINYTLNLPADLEFVNESIQNENTSGTVTYADQLLTLQNFVIPPGESTLTVNVAHKLSADATYNTQGSFTVVGGVNNPNPYLTDGDDDTEGYQVSPVTFTASELIPLPEIAITSDRVEGCGLINYTVTFENSTGIPMTGLVFETVLDEAGGQVLTIEPDNVFGGLLETISDDDTGEEEQFMITGMTIPPGTHTMTFQTDATLFAKELYNKVMVYGDGDECAESNRNEASYLEMPCETCESGRQVLYSGQAWKNAGAAGRSSHEITGVSLAGAAPVSGELMADIKVTYPSGVSEYRGGRFPRLLNGWAQLSRIDKVDGKAGAVIYRVDLKDKATGSAISAKPSFPLRGITKKKGQAERVEVYGLDCNGNIVLPVITKGPGNASQRRNAIAGNVVTGTKANYEFSGYSEVNVQFEKEVESVVIEWDVLRAPVRQNINSLLVGNMVFDCITPLNDNIDDMHVIASFQEEELPTCQEAMFKINVKNLRCVDREINLSNVLPAGLEYVEGSYAGIDVEEPVYSGNSFSLTNLTVPPGDSYLTVLVRPTDAVIATTASYSTLFTYTVVGGVNDPNPYESSNGLGTIDDFGVPVNETTILYTASTPLEEPVVVQTVDHCFTELGDTELTYTVTIENPTSQPMTGVKLTDDMLSTETYVDGSILFEDFTNNGTLEFDIDEDDNDRVHSVIVEGMEIPANSTATITYKVIANLIEPDDTETDGTQLWFTKQVLVELEPAGEDDVDCSNSAMVNSEELNVYKCVVTFCYKDPATGISQEVKGIAISTQAAQLNGWPENVPNSLLVMESTDKGFVITRISTAERDALDPVEGMFIYNTTVDQFQLYKGAANGGWVSVERGCND